MADNSYSVSIVLKGSNQLSQPVGQATQQLQRLNTEAKNTQSGLQGINTGFANMQRIMSTAFVGVTIAGAARLTEQVYNLGMETQRTETLFASFGKQVGNTSALLERLRESTRGTVTDLDLMNAASSMLSMGIAKNADEVDRLVSIGTTFAQARGEDVQASLQNLSMLLSNQSYLRLDTLGISSSAVRELADGYRKAGMDSASAFTQAFLDVAEGMAPQMNAVAEASITPFQRLRVEVENFASDFADNFAYLVNTILGELGRLGGGGGGTPGMDVAGAQAAAPVYAQLFAASGINLTDTTTGASLSSQNITGALTAAILAQQSGMDMNSAGFMDLLTQNAFGAAANDSRFNSDGGQAMLQQAASIVSWFNGYTDIVAQAERSIRTYDGVRAATARPGFAAGDNGNTGMGAVYSQYIFAVERQAQQLQSLLGGSVMRGGLQIISPDAARDAENMAYAIETMVGHLEGAGLSDAFLAPLKEAARASREGATAAAEWASNLENMSLSGIFGQTSGGRLGEIDAAVLSSLEAGGASQELLDAYRTAMGLDTGQLTAMSEQFDNEVLPMLDDIASQLGVDAFLRFRRAYEEAATDAAVAGQATVDLSAWAPGLTYYPGSGTGTGGSYTIQPGDTLSSIAAANGKTVDQLASLNNISNPGMIYAGQSLNLGGGTGGGMLVDQNFDPTEWSMMGQGMETSMSNAADDAGTIGDELQTAVDTLSTGIQGVFNQQYDLPINLVITAAGRDAVTELVRSIVQANGGTTPGSSNYNSRGGSSGSIGQFAGGHKPT